MLPSNEKLTDWVTAQITHQEPVDFQSALDVLAASCSLRGAALPHVSFARPRMLVLVADSILVQSCEAGLPDALLV
jgi:hypothetical protein